MQTNTKGKKSGVWALITVLAIASGTADAKPKEKPDNKSKAPIVLLEIDGAIVDVVAKSGNGKSASTATAVVSFYLPVIDLDDPKNDDLEAEFVAELKFRIPDPSERMLIGERVQGFIEVNAKQLDDIAKARGTIRIGDQRAGFTVEVGSGSPPAVLSNVEVYSLDGPTSGPNRLKVPLQFGETTGESSNTFVFKVPKYLVKEVGSYKIKGVSSSSGDPGI